LDKLASNEVSAVYIFLCRTNGPTLTESLLAAPPENPPSRVSILVRATGILTYEGEVVKAGTKERVGYRYLATWAYARSWEKGDDGYTAELCFDGFAFGAGKPEWDWFGEAVKVSAVVVGLRAEEFKNERHPILTRFLVQPTEGTFHTSELRSGN